jgi:urocanate hydratase
MAKAKKEIVSIGYLGNIVDLWEKLAESDLVVEIGSD